MPDEFELDLDLGQTQTTPQQSESSGLRECPGCGGKGRYVGLNEVEDPCRVCGGKGTVSAEIVWDDLNITGG